MRTDKLINKTNTIIMILLLTQSISLSTATENIIERWDYTADENIRAVGLHTINNESQILLGAGKILHIMDYEGNQLDEITLDSKGAITALTSADIDYDGVNEILIGTSYIETINVEDEYLDINKTDVGFKQKIVYRLSSNNGVVYLLDDGVITQYIEAEGWIRKIVVDELEEGWEKNIIISSGGSNIEYYRQRLPDTTYKTACLPNVKKSTGQNDEEKYTAEVSKIGDDVETCRHADACAPEIKSYHSKPSLFEDCCVSWADDEECCNSSDDSCNGTYGYTSQKQCIYLPYKIWIRDPDYPDDDQLATIDPGCYRVLRWHCGELECHKPAMQFKTDKTFNPVVSTYDTDGLLLNTVNLNKLNFSGCSLSGNYTIGDLRVLDLIKYTPGKEIVFGQGPYVVALDIELSELRGLFLGYDYSTEEKDNQQLIDIGDYIIHDFDGDEESEVMLTYPKKGEIQVLDLDYNWIQGECSLVKNQTTGEYTKDFKSGFEGYVSPDWTYRIPLNEKLERTQLTHIMPYNYTQIIIRLPSGIKLVRYGLSGMMGVYDVEDVDDIYSYDVNGDELDETFIVKGRNVKSYETSSFFINNISASTYYEYALEYKETDPKAAEKFIREAIRIYEEIENLNDLDKSKNLLAEIQKNIRVTVLNEAQAEYAKAMRYYTYNDTKAKEHALNSLNSYSSINNTDGVTKCNELIEKINKRLNETTKTTLKPTTTTAYPLNETTSTTSSMTTSTRGGGIGDNGLEMWYLLGGIIVLVASFYFFYHMIDKKRKKIS
ncbi:MAG: hypothetical protein B6U97_02655 [Candidatus Altiarchaeales archaeon ex4484_96]|nr:MAG: hypothetical protein B6U97_02655 [Candidatus Altiarchaeales archaeon ex4484_96]